MNNVEHNEFNRPCEQYIHYQRTHKASDIIQLITLLKWIENGNGRKGQQTGKQEKKED